MTELALVDGTVQVRVGLGIVFGAFEFFFSSSLYEDSGSGYCYSVFYGMFCTSERYWYWNLQACQSRYSLVTLSIVSRREEVHVWTE